MWLTLSSFIAFVSKMSPNRVFDRATALVRQDPEVVRRFGEPIKAYGRDHGGHREGRRNFIEHTHYTDPDDGSDRTRVRFNLEGRFGKAFCFAEVSKAMPDGEFVYGTLLKNIAMSVNSPSACLTTSIILLVLNVVLVQDKQNGRVMTVVDNRAALTAQRLSGGSAEGQQAFAALLGGDKK